MLIWHVDPEKPAGQTHLNPLTASTHVPPLLHVAVKHSLTSVSQNAPVYPGGQLQVLEPSEFLTHAAPCWQGYGSQTFAVATTEQFLPVYPALQVHL